LVPISPALSFASAGSGLHHKICHVLGGTWDLPHAETHAVVLPHVVAFNAPYAPRAATRIAHALGVEDPLAGLLDLAEELDAPRSLRDLGMPENALTEAAALVADAAPQDNPRPVERGDRRTTAAGGMGGAQRSSKPPRPGTEIAWVWNSSRL
jgi:alcohol dehydrogenase class IV